MSDELTATKPNDALLQRALLQFNEITSATREERLMAIEDRRFVFVQGAQWEGDWGAQFENCLRVQINKAQRGHDKIINDYRANRFTVNFRPKPGTLANDDTGELLNGLMFADMYRSAGQEALDNAFSEGCAGGFGAWRLMNEYEDEADPDNDHQRVAILPIVDADQRVFFDLDAKRYDKKDARFAYILHSMTPRAFKLEYGEDKLASWPENRARQNWFDWFRPNVVYVAEYYEVEENREDLLIFTREETDETFRYWKKDMSEEQAEDLRARGFSVRTRRIPRRRVHKWIMTGAEILEDCGYIAGEYIPIIPFYGKRVFIDNVERCKGHVRDAKDPQRVYNAQISKLTETASLSPREVPIFDPSQVEGLQDHWANMNIERHPYALAYALRDDNGNIVQAGPNSYIKPPEVPPVIAALTQQMGADIAEITNGDDGAMEIKSNVSAEAMDIASSRVDAKSYIYMDNFKQSMLHFGVVYESIAREIYVEEGREVETMDEEGETQTATLGEIHTDPATGVTGKRYDLSVGRYNVIADVTEATSTRRDKTVRTMFAFAQAAATVQDIETGQAALLTAAKNMDGEGIDDFIEYIRKRAVSIGLEKMTPEEEQQAAAAQENAPPDPQTMLIEANTRALNAQAGKTEADTELAIAKTRETETKAVKNIADARKTAMEANQPMPDATREFAA